MNTIICVGVQDPYHHYNYGKQKDSVSHVNVRCFGLLSCENSSSFTFTLCLYYEVCLNFLDYQIGFQVGLHTLSETLSSIENLSVSPHPSLNFY